MAYRYLGATHFGVFRDVLHWGSEENLPECGNNQVLIRVKYVELNPVDLQKLQPQRAGQEVPKAPFVVGYGGSGTVMMSKAEDFQEGSEVIFLADPRRSGAYATHVVVDAQCVSHMPLGYNPISAATMPLAGCTASESLEKLNLASAKKLLIVGGAGGVGTWATLLAKAKYPELTIICTASSESSQSWCKDRGASQVIGHNEILSHFEGGQQGSIDRILCLAAPEPDLWKALTEVIQPYGIMCLVVAGPAASSLDMGFCFFKAVTLATETVFSCQRTNYSHMVPSHHMDKMFELLESGKIKAFKAARMQNWKDALEEGGILDWLASGHVQGKLVMEID